MSEGFFPSSVFTQPPPTSFSIPQCGICGLYKTCNTPKMPPTGKGKRKILIVAEAPGKDEDFEGVQLVGPTGEFLEDTLAEYEINMRRDCILTNTLICRPPKNRTPTMKEIGYCLPNLTATMRKHNPEIIIPIGPPALKAVLKGIWNGTIKEFGPWVGIQIPSQKYNAWICPIWHPSFIMREQDAAKSRGTAAPLLWRKHIKAIAKLKGRPWDVVPDFKSQVEVVLDPDEAARIIDKYRKRGWAGAFDLETDRLKPDHPDAAIRTAAICWKGKRTIAFPFLDTAVDAFKRWLRSPAPKIAQNFKFEDRWMRRHGVVIKNWVWCTCTNAHIIDNRSGATGLAYLALRYFGQSSWDDHIHKFLESEYSNEPNHIWDVDITDLCVYNGLDALLEYKIANIQRKLLKFPPL